MRHMKKLYYFWVRCRNTPKGSARNKTKQFISFCADNSVAIPRKVLLEMRLINKLIIYENFLSQYPERFCSKWDPFQIGKRLNSWMSQYPERFCSKWDKNTGETKNENIVAIPRKVLLEMRPKSWNYTFIHLKSQYPERFCSKWYGVHLVIS